MWSTRQSTHRKLALATGRRNPGARRRLPGARQCAAPWCRCTGHRGAAGWLACNKHKQPLAVCTSNSAVLMRAAYQVNSKSRPLKLLRCTGLKHVDTVRAQPGWLGPMARWGGGAHMQRSTRPLARRGAGALPCWLRLPQGIAVVSGIAP